MENKLKNMFEYQKFSHNVRLDAMASEAEARFDQAISDEELFNVAAAGAPNGGAIYNTGVVEPYNAANEQKDDYVNPWK